MGSLVCAAAVAAVALATAVPATAADHGAGVGFHVHAAYLAAPTFDPTCGCLHVTAAGSAWGTHIGAGAWSDTETASFTAAGIEITGSLTLTAVDGDAILVDYDAVSPLPDATGEIHPQGTFTVVGGTGRFADATGAGTLAADANAADPSQTVTASLDGWIAY